MVMGVALAGMVFNGVFSRLSGGAVLKVYRPEMAAVFMQAFRATMLVGAGVAAAGILAAYLRGKEK